MSWEEASRIDWGIVLLFGGGLAMGQLADSTGLAAALGKWVAYQFPGSGTVGLTLVFTAIAVVLSETASNTAAANVVVPTAIAVAKAAGVSPLEPGLGATLGASLGFMMPISTPPNAIVYSSGYIPIGTMMRQGIALDIVGYVIIVTGVLGFGWMLDRTGLAILDESTCDGAHGGRAREHGEEQRIVAPRAACLARARAAGVGPRGLSKDWQNLRSRHRRARFPLK